MQLTVACNGLVETIGRVLDGQVKHPFSAHPKPDPDTGTCVCSRERQPGLRLRLQLRR